jgi:xylulokinase
VAAQDLLLGLDLGTSSLKGIFISATGEILAKYEIALTLHRDGDVVEQDAREYIAALAEFVALDRKNHSLLNRVRAIGLSGHTPSLVAIDESGAPTAPVIIWQDNRATDQARALAEKFGDPRELIGTSLPWSPSATPAKALWLSENRPEVRKSTRWLLQPKDFLGFLLTGHAISDPWSTKGLCNVRTQQVIEPLLTTIGWDTEVVPQLRDGFASRGETTQECATRFGIPEGIPVSVGWSDAMCGMLALGAFSKPTSFIITGTSAIVGTSSAVEPRHDQPLYLIPAGSAPYPVTFGPTQMSGGSISWAAKLFGTTENDLVALGDSDVSANVPLYLPYIAGERAPLWRSDIRGRFTDVSVEHGASAFARATMEGICFAERQVLEMSQELTGAENLAGGEVVLSGRAGNDPHWLATRLRTMGRSLRVVDDMEITCRGAAILADVMLTRNFPSSTAALSISGRVHHPRPSDLEYGRENFRKFLAEQKALLAKSAES